MVLLLFPAVCVFTPVLVPAAVVVGVNEVLGLPIGALLLVVLVAVWLSSKILPIVRIHADLAIMRGVAVWAPNSFEVEHVEIGVLLELV
jgi:hypothetical protein